MQRRILGTLLLLAGAVVTAHAADGLQMTGFASAAWSGEAERRAARFNFEQAELDLQRELSPQASVRADLEWVWDGEAWAGAVEQGWLAYRPQVLPRLTLTGGRFNAPIGFEALDPPDLQQVSHGLLFTWATPAYLTGAMATGDLGHGLELKAYAVNDWDLNGESNASPTLGGRLGWTRTGLACGGSVIHALRDSFQTLRQTVFDADFSCTAVPRVLLGAELNGCIADADGVDASWAGVLLVANVTLNPRASFTARWDLLDDSDGLAFGTGGERRQSVTGAAVWTLAPGMRLLAELRADLSDHDVFTDHAGKPCSSVRSGALRLVGTY